MFKQYNALYNSSWTFLKEAFNVYEFIYINNMELSIQKNLISHATIVSFSEKR